MQLMLYKGSESGGRIGVDETFLSVVIILDFVPGLSELVLLALS